jgi:hypothetical protein
LKALTCYCGGWQPKPKLKEREQFGVEIYNRLIDWAMPEAELQKWLEGYLEVSGWIWQHNNDSRRANSGFPDINAVHPDLNALLYVELKTMAGEESQPKAGRRRRGSFSQQEWLDALEGWGNTARSDSHAINEFGDPPDWHFLVMRNVRPCCRERVTSVLGNLHSISQPRLTVVAPHDNEGALEGALGRR